MLVFASAQIVMVLDTSVMNVAISQIFRDLDTTIQCVQTAITLYTLVMAVFMLLSAKFGDILGPQPCVCDRLGDLRRRLADDGAEPEPRRVLLVGWSGVEGFGAVLVVPAIEETAEEVSIGILATAPRGPTRASGTCTRWPFASPTRWGRGAWWTHIPDVSSSACRLPSILHSPEVLEPGVSVDKRISVLSAA